MLDLDLDGIPGVDYDLSRGLYRILFRGNHRELLTQARREHSDADGLLTHLYKMGGLWWLSLGAKALVAGEPSRLRAASTALMLRADRKPSVREQKAIEELLRAGLKLPTVKKADVKRRRR